MGDVPPLVGVAMKVTVVPWHTLLPLAAMLTPTALPLVTDKTSVALLSQPAALVKPVLVWLPAALNVNPFHT